MLPYTIEQASELIRDYGVGEPKEIMSCYMALGFEEFTTQFPTLYDVVESLELPKKEHDEACDWVHAIREGYIEALGELGVDVEREEEGIAVTVYIRDANIPQLLALVKNQEE